MIVSIVQFSQCTPETVPLAFSGIRNCAPPRSKLESYGDICEKLTDREIDRHRAHIESIEKLLKDVAGDHNQVADTEERFIRLHLEGLPHDDRTQQQNEHRMAVLKFNRIASSNFVERLRQARTELVSAIHFITGRKRNPPPKFDCQNSRRVRYRGNGECNHEVNCDERLVPDPDAPCNRMPPTFGKIRGHPVTTSIPSNHHPSRPAGFPVHRFGPTDQWREQTTDPAQDQMPLEHMIITVHSIPTTPFLPPGFPTTRTLYRGSRHKRKGAITTYVTHKRHCGKAMYGRWFAQAFWHEPGVVDEPYCQTATLERRQ